MPSYAPQCKNCSGEDCPCCSVFQEERASQRAAQYNEPEEPDFECDYDRDCDDDEETEGDCDDRFVEDDDEGCDVREDFGWGNEDVCPEG